MHVVVVHENDIVRRRYEFLIAHDRAHFARKKIQNLNTAVEMLAHAVAFSPRNSHIRIFVVEIFVKYIVHKIHPKTIKVNI